MELTLIWIILGLSNFPIPVDSLYSKVAFDEIENIMNLRRFETIIGKGVTHERPYDRSVVISF
ncbi:MAG: hypothetical protein ACTSW1_00420 [Candidatus Hodarchaeales archaeon]